MLSNLSKLTAFQVEDPVRPWGQVHDFLVEFPTGIARYFSVDAHVGVGVKEIWAPLESIESVDTKGRSICVQTEIDHKMVKQLSRLEAPEKDQDELRLHRLYNTKPSWVSIKKRKGGPLRRESRLLRGSDLIGFEATASTGQHGWVKDLIFDDETLSLRLLRLQLNEDGIRTVIDIPGGTYMLYPESRSVFVNVE